MEADDVVKSNGDGGVGDGVGDGAGDIVGDDKSDDDDDDGNSGNECDGDDVMVCWRVFVNGDDGDVADNGEDK